jgi:3',5'-cyclic AMP phosphodiesterase CpdA
VFTLAHLSDIHLSPMPPARRVELMSKRILGYVNWHRGRKLVHRREILDLLTRDIVERKPDHIAVTGDLVNLGSLTNSCARRNGCTISARLAA